MTPSRESSPAPGGGAVETLKSLKITEENKFNPTALSAALKSFGDFKRPGSASYSIRAADVKQIQAIAALLLEMGQTTTSSSTALTKEDLRQAIDEITAKCSAPINNANNNYSGPQSYASATAQGPLSNTLEPKKNHTADKEVIISTMQIPRTHKIFSATPKELGAVIDAAFKAFSDSSEGNLLLHKVECHSIHLLANKNLRVQAKSEEEARKILEHSDGWIKHLSPEAKVIQKKYPVVISFVPTGLDLSDLQEAKQELESSNPHIAPYSIDSLRWLIPFQAASPLKTHSSLLAYFKDKKSANAVIEENMAIHKQTCYAHKYIPPPLQCYRCQQYGHHSSSTGCSGKVICAKCSENHSTKDCPCTDNVKCINTKTCRHHPIKCANCGEGHPSFDKRCVNRVTAHAEQMTRPEYTTHTYGNYYDRPPTTSRFTIADSKFKTKHERGHTRSFIDGPRNSSSIPNDDDGQAWNNPPVPDDSILAR